MNTFQSVVRTESSLLGLKRKVTMFSFILLFRNASVTIFRQNKIMEVMV